MSPIDNATVQITDTGEEIALVAPNDAILEADTKTSAAADPPNQAALMTSTSDNPAITSVEAGKKTPSPYGAYFKSFGSPLAISIVLGTELAYIAIDRAGGTLLF